jgi:Cysteine-rich secretory protein family
MHFCIAAKRGHAMGLKFFLSLLAGGALTGQVCLAFAATTESPIAAQLLASHNEERRALGVAALVWDETLAADAQSWAKHLASKEVFEHAPQRNGALDEGENLWMGTAGAYTPDEMVGAWRDERKYYRNGVFPRVSSTGDWQDVGHYTQLIWHSTKRVGCALARGKDNEYLVCRYAPPGNWMGQNALGSPIEKPKRAAKSVIK